MARPNKGRGIGAEQAAARRLELERLERGWSYDGLARRMTEVGCTIQPSALFKVEKGNPPRRITFDEAVALAKLFGISVDELAEPREVGITRTTRELLAAEERAYVGAKEAFVAVTEARERLVRHLQDHPDQMDLLPTMAADGTEQGVVLFPPLTRRVEQAAPARTTTKGGGRRG